MASNNPSSSLTSLSSITQTMSSPTSFATPPVPSNVGPSGQQTTNNTTIATSASLYLYTFLATLILLLTVSAAIVIRSYILRRRHRLLMEEAVRNGTYVPPIPPIRPPKVDLSKKPVLWEAYIDGKGEVNWYAESEKGNGKKTISPWWKFENAIDWEMIKPFSASYLGSLGKDVSAIVNLSSAALAPATSTDAPTPVPREEANVAHRFHIRRPRNIFSQAREILSPTPQQTSPLPEGDNSDSNPDPTNGKLPATPKDLNNPTMMRVAVFIAMPSPPSSSLLTSGVSNSSRPSPSHSPASMPSFLSTEEPQSSPLQSSSLPRPSPSIRDGEEHSLPHLEVGVAEVLIVPSNSADLGTEPSNITGKKNIPRMSMGSTMTEGSL